LVLLQRSPCAFAIKFLKLLLQVVLEPRDPTPRCSHLQHEPAVLLMTAGAILILRHVTVNETFLHCLFHSVPAAEPLENKTARPRTLSLNWNFPCAASSITTAADIAIDKRRVDMSSSR
jgi:hypothetical protein